MDFDRLCGDLLPDDVLQGNGISGELADTLAQLLDSHPVLVEVEAEERLVLDVRLLLDVEGGSLARVKLLGDGLGGVEELVQQLGLYTPALADIQSWRAVRKVDLPRWSGNQFQPAR